MRVYLATPTACGITWEPVTEPEPQCDNTEYLTARPPGNLLSDHLSALVGCVYVGGGDYNPLKISLTLFWEEESAKLGKSLAPQGPRAHVDLKRKPSLPILGKK